MAEPENIEAYLYRSHCCYCQDFLPALKVLRIQKLEDTGKRTIADGKFFRNAYDSRHHRIHRHFRHVDSQRPRQSTFFIQRFQGIQKLESADHHFRRRWTQKIEPDEVVDAEGFELEKVK